MYVRELYISVQWVFNNAICVTVLSLGCCTVIRIFGMVHLLQGVQQDMIIWVDSLRQSYTNVCQADVQILITCARNCGLHHIDHLGLGQCYVPFQNRTLGVMGTTETHDLCTQSVVTVRQCMSGSCTDLYNRCTKTPLASEWSPWYGVLPCALSELYACCKGYNGNS